MKKVFYTEKPSEKIVKSVFLAGPTPRNGNCESWRPKALEIFERKGFDGTVIIPEAKDFNKNYDNFEYKGIIDFERSWLDLCDVILFWVPRSDLLPAFTTNIEYGNYIKTGKIVIGSPKDAPKMGYLRHMANEKNMPWFDTLENTIDEAIKVMGSGILRKNDEVLVPKNIYNDEYFKDWLLKEKEKGNTLKSLKVEYFDEKSWLINCSLFNENSQKLQKNVLIFKK